MGHYNKIKDEIKAFLVFNLTLEDLERSYIGEKPIPKGWAGNKRNIKGLTQWEWNDIRTQLRNEYVYQVEKNVVIVPGDPPDTETIMEDRLSPEANNINSLMSTMDMTLSKIRKYHFYLKNLHKDVTEYFISETTWNLLAYINEVIDAGSIMMPTSQPGFFHRSSGNSRFTKYQLEMMFNNSKLGDGIPSPDDFDIEDKKTWRELLEGQITIDDILEIACDLNILTKGNDGSYFHKNTKDAEESLEFLSWTKTTYKKDCGDFTKTKDGKIPDEFQLAAIKKIVESDKLVHGVIGAAGSGKSFTASCILEAFGDPELRPIYLAPTGKAALVLQHASGHEAHTISKYSRMLGPDTRPPGKNILFIDESSMINSQFMHELLSIIDYIKPQKIVFMGDGNQLPPVGIGNFFIDLKTLIPYEFHMLKKSHRIKNQTYISTIEKFNVSYPEFTLIPEFKYRQVVFPEVPEYCNIAHLDSIAHITNIIFSMSVEDLIHKDLTFVAYHKKVCNYINILCIYRVTGNAELGRRIDEINQAFAKYGIGNISNKKLFQGGKHAVWELVADAMTFIKRNNLHHFPKSKVMITKNCYRNSYHKKCGIDNIEKFGMLPNGLVCISQNDGTMSSLMDHHGIIPSMDVSAPIVPAFAITVHKMQGSQARNIVFFHVSHNTGSDLVYTALTRATENIKIYHLHTYGKTPYNNVIHSLPPISKKTYLNMGNESDKEKQFCNGELVWA